MLHEQQQQQHNSEEEHGTALVKTFHFEDYTAAFQFAEKVNEMCNIMNHYPTNMNFTHHGVVHGGSGGGGGGGHNVDLEMTWFTTRYAATTQQQQQQASTSPRLTQKDYLASHAVDLISTSTHDNEINMNDYSYNLHESSIATFPSYPRGSSKLLTYTDAENGEKVEYYKHFESIMPSLLQNCHVIFNDSRVLDARLYINVNNANSVNDNDIRNNEEKIELMLLDLGDVDVDMMKCQDIPLRAMIRMETIQKGNVFTIICNKSQQQQQNESIDASGGQAGNVKKVQVKVVDIVGIWQEDEKSNGNGMECFVCIDSDQTIQEFLHYAGSVPIPPYFHRAAVESDVESYNTVYAAHGGSVAAPTAGLHFTRNVLSQIGNDNISYLSLHVGAGTFQPVMQVQDARRHVMHAESFAVPVIEIKRIIMACQQGKPIVAVGTTSTRTLESLYWCGIKYIAAKTAVAAKDSSAALNKEDKTATKTTTKDLVLGQFEWIPLNVVAATAGEEDKNNQGTRITRIAALQALIDNWQEGNDDNTDTAAVIRGRTSLMITPESYEFQMVDRLVTNFHAPDSTLMLLVSAFIKSNGYNQKIRKIYEDAQEHGFRFLSYGDSCLFTKATATPSS